MEKSFLGEKGLLQSLNQRLFAIRRLANHIPRDKLKMATNSIWMLKARYYIQLTDMVRLTEEDKKMKNIKATQLAQNKMLRLLDGSRVKDKRRIWDMLEKFGMLSINQTIAQIKLTEAWKANKDDNYPIKLRWTRENAEGTEQQNTSQTTQHTQREGGKTTQAEQSFARDTGKVWNQAPKEIKESKTLGAAKNLIKIYCKMLPI